MKNFLILLIFIHCFLFALTVIKLCTEDINYSTSEHCYIREGDLYKYFATKTTYFSVINNFPIENEYKVNECTSQYLYFFGRHAIRYPDAEDINNMQQYLLPLQQKILAQYSNSSLCSKDLESLTNWRLDINLEDDNRISFSGLQEAYNIAQRFKRHFKSLLNQNYSAQKFSFGVTSKKRTQTTAKAFFTRLFGNESLKNLELQVLDILQFHKTCLQHRGKQKKNLLSPLNLFKNSSRLKNVIKDISIYLNTDITYEELDLIYDACRFETALYGKSPWCSVFTMEHLKLLEYLEDLDDMEKDGYLDPINAKQTCPLFKNLLAQLSNQIKQPTKASDFYFSHAGAFKKIITALGLFKDEVVYDYSSEMNELDKRQWRSSFICPFSGNIAFLLSRCSDNKFKVTVFLHEVPVIIPGCDAINCDYATFVFALSNITNNCDLEKICTRF